MTERPRWTTSSEIEAKLMRVWSSGRLLSDRLRPPEIPEVLFPWQLRLRRPDPRALGAELEAVQLWSRALEAGSKTARGFGYEIVWEEINHRQIGRNRLPAAVVVSSEEDALALLGMQDEARRFSQLAEATLASFASLEPWLVRRPLVVLEHEAVWPRILAVLGWLRAHPRPSVYLRQLEIPGVDSKFIETYKGLLCELLDSVLPAEAIDSEALGTRQFELRYGILPKPPLVRFRLLDPTQQLGTLTDIATPAPQFARLDLPIERVFITENETNGLAFPPCADSIVIFGLGYGLQRLAEVAWLQNKRVYYWGDLDTHGFVMLDRLRANLPHASSLLMDRETLMLHRPLWGHEASPHIASLTRLREAEAELYDDLKLDKLGVGVRLEQERIAFAWVREALSTLLNSGG